jgi:hypothetical protein
VCVTSPKKQGPSDQITNVEKKQIRSRARRLATDLLKAKLGEGLQTYQETIEQLYDGRARLRICLKCGEIDSTANLSKRTHTCTKDFFQLSFPYLVTTSWLRMREFFLGESYTLMLQKLGFEPIEIKPITTTKPVKADASTEELLGEAEIPEES